MILYPTPGSQAQLNLAAKHRLM